jgi:hypothetical protein
MKNTEKDLPNSSGKLCPEGDYKAKERAHLWKNSGLLILRYM